MKTKFIEINDPERIEELFDDSHSRPVVFFKHSLTCGISSAVYHEVAKIDSTIWVIVIQNARKVSDRLAERSGTRHESPQLLIIKNSVAIYSASHFDIAAGEVEDVLNKERVSI